jgi:hypothetical protein
MLTGVLYNAILFVACLFAYFAEHGNEKLSRFFNRPFALLSSKIPFALHLGNEKHFRLFCRFIVFLVLFLPASLRYGTGADYFSYVDIFHIIYYLPSVEIGWALLNKGIHFLGLPVQWVFVFSSFLMYFPICFVIKRKNYFYSIVFYLILGFYFSSFNVIRQYLAVSLVICAVTSLEHKKNLRFFLWIACASLFHLSALFVLPFFPLKYVKYKKNITPIVIMILGIIICIKFNVLDFALSIFEKINLKYALYRTSKFAARRTNIGTGLGVLIKILPSLLVVFFAPKIIKKYPQKAFLVNLSILYVWLFFLSAQFLVLGRARDIFVFVPVLITGFAFPAAGKYKKFVAIALISLNLLLLEKDIKNIPDSGYALWMNPYYSIFSDLTREEIFQLNKD